MRIRSRSALLGALSWLLLASSPAYAASLSELQARVRRAPEDAGARLELGEAFAKQEDSLRAWSHLLEAARLRPRHAGTLLALGDLAAAEDQEERAVGFWVQAYDLDPRSPAAERLRAHRPALLQPPTEVQDVAELLEVCEHLVDFRQQREVEQALQEYAVRKALSIELADENWRSFVESLHTSGLMSRPSLPPSGRGAYLTDEAGRLFSTVYGSPGNASGAPAAIRNPRGFRASAAVMTEALRKGGDGAAECLLPRFEDDALVELPSRALRNLGGLEDPWAVDALLQRLARLAFLSDVSLPERFVPLVRRFAARAPEARQRYLAVALLHDAGAGDLPRFRRDDLDAILVGVSGSRLPLAALQGALAALGPRAEAFLAAQLRGEPDRARRGSRIRPPRRSRPPSRRSRPPPHRGWSARRPRGASTPAWRSESASDSAWWWAWSPSASCSAASRAGPPPRRGPRRCPPHRSRAPPRTRPLRTRPPPGSLPPSSRRPGAPPRRGRRSPRESTSSPTSPRAVPTWPPARSSPVSS